MKSQFNLSNFISVVKAKGLAKVNRFEVQINPPPALQKFTDDGRLVTLFCEISNLPGIAVTTKGQRIYGPAYQKPVSLEYGGEAISMTFYVDTKFATKAFFDAWIFSIINPNSFNAQYQFKNNRPENTADIIIKQLDDKDNETYTIKLIDAFPKAINMMDLNMGALNQTHKLIVTFGYRKWVPTSSSYNYDTLTTPTITDPMQAIGTII